MDMAQFSGYNSTVCKPHVAKMKAAATLVGPVTLGLMDLSCAKLIADTVPWGEQPG